MKKLLPALFLAPLLAAAAALAAPPAQDPALPEQIPWAGDVITAFKVADLEASVAWYRRVLGCEVKLDLLEMGWCELSTPAEHSLIGLGQAEPDEELHGSGDASLSFGVRDIEAVRARLRAAGAKTGEVVEIPQTVKLLDFEDPDGNRLMLHQSLSAE